MVSTNLPSNHSIFLLHNAFEDFIHTRLEKVLLNSSNHSHSNYKIHNTLCTNCMYKLWSVIFSLSNMYNGLIDLFFDILSLNKGREELTTYNKYTPHGFKYSINPLLLYNSIAKFVLKHIYQ